MLRLTDQQYDGMKDAVPIATLSFLHGTGVPEIVEFRGIDHVFSLDLEPMLSGNAFRIGTVDSGSYAMGVQRTTGHFGYAFGESEQPPWCFVNSSVQYFLSCLEACQNLWELQTAKKIAEDARADFLERLIREIDPVVFADENNVWSFLVEELRNGIV